MNFCKRRHGYTVYEYNANNSTAYNCHSFAWEETLGDQLDPRNEYPVSLGAYRWDNNPDNNMAGFEQLDKNEPNKKEDRVLYYVDSNHNWRIRTKLTPSLFQHRTHFRLIKFTTPTIIPLSSV